MTLYADDGCIDMSTIHVLDAFKMETRLEVVLRKAYIAALRSPLPLGGSRLPLAAVRWALMKYRDP
jgi:hypothetical protein